MVLSTGQLISKFLTKSTRSSDFKELSLSSFRIQTLNLTCLLLIYRILSFPFSLFSLHFRHSAQNYLSLLFTYNDDYNGLFLYDVKTLQKNSLKYSNILSRDPQKKSLCTYHETFELGE